MTSKEMEKFSFNNDNYLILVRLEHYEKTASGKTWKSKPETTEHNIFTSDQYTNFVTAGAWFNRFFRTDFYGNKTKAHCTIEKSYTAAGYLPTYSVNVNPDATKKTVASIDFINKSKLEKMAGYREKEILNNLETWGYNYNNGYSIYSFTDKNGYSCEYSEKLQRFVG